jgi:parvulin-like peptidyl-prolyl isomerase
VFRPIHFVSALGAVFFAIVGLAACGGIPGNAVVQVNGTPITKEAFNHWMSVAASSTVGATGSKPVIPDPPKYKACIAHLEATAPKPAKGQSKPTAAQLKSQCEQQYTALRQEVLGFLISSAWVIGEAESVGVKVSDAEVKKEFQKIRDRQFPQAAEFKKFLQTSGQTVSDLLLRVKLNMLSTKIQKKVAKEHAPNKADIKKYYEQHKSTYGTPEKRDFRIILTKTEAEANEAKQEIESGASFASVAESKSTDPSKVRGGQLTGVAEGREAKALDEAVFSAKKGVLGGPVKTPFGYYLYEVNGIHAGSQQTLAQAEAQIKQQLDTQNQQEALRNFIKEFRKKWEAKTECASGYVVQNCHNYKQPKTTPTKSGPTTTTTKSTPTKSTTTKSTTTPSK